MEEREGSGQCEGSSDEREGGGGVDDGDIQRVRGCSGKSSRDASYASDD